MKPIKTAALSTINRLSTVRCVATIRSVDVWKNRRRRTLQLLIVRLSTLNSQLSTINDRHSIPLQLRIYSIH
ncbi:MAG: hypothetical protein ACRC62_00400 [Microcoleus sp.]